MMQGQVGSSQTKAEAEPYSLSDTGLSASGHQ